MAAKRLDLRGKTFGRLKVLHISHSAKNGDILWKCECSCGNIILIRASNLKSGNTSSCGCLAIDIRTSHNMSGIPEYKVWEGIIQRCTNPKTSNYNDYGGRGIKVCQRWFNFKYFIEDMGRRPSSKYKIDRIDNNGNYEPNNCRWVTQSIQSKNSRNHKTNKTGVRGVTFINNKYRASISVNNKTLYLGTYKTLNDAKEARKKAETQYWGKEYSYENNED